MSIGRVLLRIGAIALLALPPVAANAANAPRFESVWIIEPKLDGSPPGTARNGDILFQQRLLPVGLKEVAGNFSQGDLALPAGTEFYRTVSRDVPIYCSIRPERQFSGTGAKVEAGRNHVCLIDTDRNGQFDAYFKRNSITRGVPIISGRARKSTPIAGLAMREKPVAEGRDRFVIAVQHDSKPAFRNDRRLLIIYGENGHYGELTIPEMVENDGFPEDVQVLGSTLRITGLEGDRLTYEVLAPMPRQPFSVSVKTIRY